MTIDGTVPTLALTNLESELLQSFPNPKVSCSASGGTSQIKVAAVMVSSVTREKSPPYVALFGRGAAGALRVRPDVGMHVDLLPVSQFLLPRYFFLL